MEITEPRDPNGKLLCRGRSNPQKRLLHLRDSLLAIKRYLYRRICQGAFPSLSSDVQISKGDLRRFATWLQPTMSVEPTKTETLCFNARLRKNIPQGIGTPAVLFPTLKRASKEFHQPTYGRLKERIFVKRQIPVHLLDVLSGKSFTKHRDSDGCSLISKRRSRDPLIRHRLLFEECGTHGTVATFRSQTGFVTHYGNGVRLWPLLTNRYSILASKEEA